MKTNTLMLVIFAVAMSVACKKEVAEPAKNETIKVSSFKASGEDKKGDIDYGKTAGNDTGGEDKPKPTSF